MGFVAIAEEEHVFLCHVDMLVLPDSAVYLMKLAIAESMVHLYTSATLTLKTTHVIMIIITLGQFFII